MKPTWCTFHSIYWESRASTCFRHYFLILRRRNTNGIWYIACARLQFHRNRATANWHSHAIYQMPFFAESPEDEQLMLETCRDSWFSIKLIRSSSRWFHYTVSCCFYANSVTGDWRQSGNTWYTGGTKSRPHRSCSAVTHVPVTIVLLR
jgi:hypothetical protein